MGVARCCRCDRRCADDRVRSGVRGRPRDVRVGLIVVGVVFVGIVGFSIVLVIEVRLGLALSEQEADAGIPVVDLDPLLLALVAEDIAGLSPTALPALPRGVE